MHRRFRALAALSAMVVGACGSSDAAAPPTPETLGGVGALPGTIAPVTAVVEEDAAPVSVTVDEPEESVPVSVPADVAIDEETRRVGRIVDGNRVLVIGDSILASISDRYGDQLCDRLVPRGWEVQVDAEVSRFVDFGRRVLDEHDVDDWDAAVVMLGNNYDGEPQAFADELNRLLDQLEPLPVVLGNVTPVEPEQDEVNYILAASADGRQGVRLLDWATRTAADTPGADRLLAGDGLHLSTAGQDALAGMIARELGTAPAGSEGTCLPSPFRDDSGGTLPDPES